MREAASAGELLSSDPDLRRTDRWALGRGGQHQMPIRQSIPWFGRLALEGVSVAMGVKVESGARAVVGVRPLPFCGD